MLILKRMKKIFSLSLVVLVVSCSNDTWSDKERSVFFTGCINEGGSKDYCECYLEKVMYKNPIAEDANDMDYETKIELSKNCDLN